jgi:hypothetical protein
MLPSIELRYVTFEVSLSAFQMRRPVHRGRLRLEWVLYPLQDGKFEDIDVDVPASQISEKIIYKLTELEQPAKN